jgi:hypothetical protein
MTVRVEPDWSAVELADGASDVLFNKDVPFLPPLQKYNTIKCIKTTRLTRYLQNIETRLYSKL